MRQLRMSSAIVVPLRARHRTLGAIMFIFAESGRQYSTHELELAEELGRRAGLALDHARLYEREHRTAETLQRALLPPTLPEVEGHEVAARYLPGRRGHHVGGDWYDAFVPPDERIGIAIGDIGGRGGLPRRSWARSATGCARTRSRRPARAPPWPTCG